MLRSEKRSIFNVRRFAVFWQMCRLGSATGGMEINLSSNGVLWDVQLKGRML